MLRLSSKKIILRFSSKNHSPILLKKNSIFTYRSVASWTKWSEKPNRRHIGGMEFISLANWTPLFHTHSGKCSKMVQKCSKNARYWKHLKVNYFSKKFPFPHFPIWYKILKFIRALRLMLRAVELKFKRNSFLLCDRKKCILNLSFASYLTNAESMRHPSQQGKRNAAEKSVNDVNENDEAKQRYFPH